MEPNVQIYDSFSELVELKKQQATEAVKEATTTLKREWFQPDKAEEASCLDVESIPKKFPREDCQKAYTEYLQGKRIPIDATAIKFQNGFIAADEQAYRIRHQSIPRSLAQCYMEDVRWSKGIIPYLLINHIKVLNDLAQQDYEAKNK